MYCVLLTTRVLYHHRACKELYVHVLHATVDMHVATQASCVSLAARIGLGMLVWWALRRYKSAVTRVFGAGVAQWLMLITMSQFHFVFYMSRPLPNTFALILGETAAQHVRPHPR